VAAAAGTACAAAGRAPALAAERVEARALAAQGDSLRAVGDLERAAASYRAALDADKALCEAHYGLARLALDRKDPAAARKHLERCEGKEKHEGIYFLGSALAHLEERRLEDAEILLIKAAARDGSDAYRRDVELAFVALYEAKDVLRLAVDHLDQVIALSPDDAAPQIRKGRLLVAIREYDAAAAAFRAALAIDSTAVEAHDEIATLLTRAKRPADAAAELARIAAVRGKAADYLALAAAWEAAHDARKALDAYRRAVEIEPASDVARLGLARSAFEVGERDSAVAHYAAVSDSTLLSAEDFERIGRAHLDRKELAPARAAYVAATLRDSTRADAYFYAGYTFLAERSYADAIPLFEKRIAIDSTSAAAFANLGLCYLQTNNPNRGIEMLNAAVRIRPDDVSSRVWLAQALAAQSQWSRAAEEYRAAIAADSANADAWRGLGYSLLSQERYSEAVRVLVRANGLDPRNVQGLVWLAQGYGLTGDLDKAEAIFNKALSIDPQSADAKDGLEAIQKVNKNKKGRKQPSR
jgi:tetratricopeptide (TPR) repeat protein